MTPVPKRAGAADLKNAVTQKLVFAKHATAPVATALWEREGHKQTEQNLDKPHDGEEEGILQDEIQGDHQVQRACLYQLL